MLVTILEARVTSERWRLLTASYRRGIKGLPLALLQTFLIQDTKNPNVWRIISEWRNREDYARFTGENDNEECCAAMFKAVGVVPTCRVFELRAHHEHV